MELTTIDIEKPMQQAAANGEAHTKGFIELVSSFEHLHAPQVQMLLGRLLDGRLRVAEAFAVRLTSEEGQFIAEAYEVGEVGIGRTQSEALRDLQATLGELYSALERDADRLGADMLNVWEMMQRKVTKRA